MKLLSQTNLLTCILTSTIAATSWSTATWARDESTPNWPCVQRKVLNISVAQVWDGPPIKDVKGWWSDKETMGLINVLAARRTPREDAEKAVKAFAESQDKEKRDEALTLVFAGLFDKVNATRRGIINGLERYFKAQEKRALEIEKRGTELSKLQDVAESDGATEEDQAKFQKAKSDYDWASRIFQERQSNMPLACEVPVLLDKHLFQMAQLIRQNMES